MFLKLFKSLTARVLNITLTTVKSATKNLVFRSPLYKNLYSLKFETGPYFY